jgi:hypothetical protein
MSELLPLLVETTLLEVEAAPAFRAARAELLALAADPAERDALDGATANLAAVVARLAFVAGVRFDGRALVLASS